MTVEITLLPPGSPLPERNEADWAAQIKEGLEKIPRGERDSKTLQKEDVFKAMENHPHVLGFFPC